ncbi:hypothetical protein VTH82DRAFT_2900 [Thermothelomyces myriococcoides]
MMVPDHKRRAAGPVNAGRMRAQRNWAKQNVRIFASRAPIAWLDQRGAFLTEPRALPPSTAQHDPMA